MNWSASRAAWAAGSAEPLLPKNATASQGGSLSGFNKGTILCTVNESGIPRGVYARPHDPQSGTHPRTAGEDSRRQGFRACSGGPADHGRVLPKEEENARLENNEAQRNESTAFQTTVSHRQTLERMCHDRAPSSLSSSASRTTTSSKISTLPTSSDFTTWPSHQRYPRDPEGKTPHGRRPHIAKKV